MKDKILQVLREADDFISGQEICNRFSVSRTAVWKAIKQLRDEGYSIEAVNNKGYRLEETPDVISAQELGSLLHTQWFGKEILYFDSIDSTNNELKRQAEKGVKHGLLAVAEEQTAGRGRRGHAWVSPPGTGIWFSFLLKPEISPDKASMLTIVAAMAVSGAIREVTGLDAQIKWPNDIVVNGKKICGILTEMGTNGVKINYVLIGVGINVNLKEFPEEMQDKATSLILEGGHEYDRNHVIAQVMKYFEINYEKFIQTCDFTHLLDDYHRILANLNQPVRVIDGDRSFEGICRGIDEKGELLVERQNKEVVKVSAGEVSVRGLYSYV